MLLEVIHRTLLYLYHFNLNFDLILCFSASTADPVEVLRIFEYTQPYGNHNGGQYVIKYHLPTIIIIINIVDFCSELMAIYISCLETEAMEMTHIRIVK